MSGLQAGEDVNDFILDAAYRAAEQTLLDQRLFMVSGSQYQALLEMLDRPQSDLAPKRASQPPPKPLRLPQNSTNCRPTYVFALQKWQALTDKHDRQPQAGRGSSPVPDCRNSWSKQGQSQYWQALEAIKNIVDPVPAKPYESKDCVLGVANCLLARMLRYLLQPAGPSSGGFSNNVPRRTPCNAPCAPYKRASP
ncbi:type II toxin-antitoxin system TacA family antitoxin [Melaminivora jejuensis]